MRQRVFLGIKASSRLQELVLTWQSRHKDLPVRFIKPNNLHITLVAPWYERRVGRAIATLRSVQSKPFTLRFNTIIVNKKNCVIWAEPSSVPREIASIREFLLRLFRRSKEKRAFVPHLTIARWKRGSILYQIIPQTVRWKQDVNRITLFLSRLGSKEATYETLSEKILVSSSLAVALDKTREIDIIGTLQ